MTKKKKKECDGHDESEDEKGDTDKLNGII